MCDKKHRQHKAESDYGSEYCVTAKPITSDKTLKMIDRLVEKYNVSSLSYLFGCPQFRTNRNSLRPSTHAIEPCFL